MKVFVQTLLQISLFISVTLSSGHLFVWPTLQIGIFCSQILRWPSISKYFFEVLFYLSLFWLVRSWVRAIYITCCAQAKAGFHVLQCMFNWEGAKYSELQMPKSESFLWVCINLGETAMLHYAFGGLQIIYILISLLNTRYRSLRIVVTTIFGSFVKEQI